MRVWSVTLVSLLAAAAFAGCSGDDSVDGGGSSGGGGIGGATDPIVIPKSEDGKGAIAGVVVDEGLNPLPDVTIKVTGTSGTFETVTGDKGQFVLTDLEPGTYFIEASKPGYVSQNDDTDVFANDDDPKVVKIRLKSDPSSRQYYDTYPDEGFIECSAGAGNVHPFVDNSYNPCFASDQSKTVFQHNLSGRIPDFVQSEMSWDPNSDPTVLLLSMTQFRGTNDFDNYATESGESPVVVRVNGTVLEAWEIGTNYPLLLRVFAAYNEDNPATAVINQEFRIITHVFYGYEPDEDYQFSKDGAPPDP